MNYLDAETVIELHELILKYSNGLSGVRNMNLLKSPLEAIKNDTYYPNFNEKLAFLLYSFVKNHPFTDGNKRTAIVICALFMSINGYDDREVNIFAVWGELMALNIASGNMNLEEIKESSEFLLRLTRKQK